jgi:hypothetical protein
MSRRERLWSRDLRHPWMNSHSRVVVPGTGRRSLGHGSERGRGLRSVAEECVDRDALADVRGEAGAQVVFEFLAPVSDARP